MKSAHWFTLLALSAWPLTGHAQANVRRSLVETPEIKAAVARVSAASIKADATLAECLPKRHLSTDAVDWFCKVGALRLAAGEEAVNPDMPLEKNKGLQKRAKLVSLALDAADAVGFYKPTAAVPMDLPKWQVAAQAEACRAVADLYSAIVDVPESKPVGKLLEGFPKAHAPRLDKGLKELTCECHDRTLAIGRSGFLNEREPALARAQKQTYALSCNIKSTGRESTLVNLKRERSDVDLSSVGGSAKGADVDKDEAQRVADRRKAELKMCVDDNARGSAATEKMARCACPLMQRWRFPKREAEAPLQLKVQVSDKLGALQLEVGQKGTVDKCVVAGP